MHRHPTGRGQKDTRAVTLSTGKQNRSRNAGKPYSTITWAEMLRRAENPTQVAKDKAPWVMASVYSEFDARTAEVQRERGSYAMLPGDIDEGNVSQAQLEAALHQVFGPCEWLIHSSSSATPDNRKWRYWVRLAEPLTPADFEGTQKAVLALLLAEGVKADSKISDLNRLFYLPNVPTDKRCPQTGEPLFYRWKHHKGPRLELHPQHAIVLRRDERAAEAAAEAQRLAEAREAAKKHRAAQCRSEGAPYDFESTVAAFNAAHSLEGELLRYGWTGGPVHYRSPFQTSQSFATRVYPEGYAISLSESDACEGLGHVTPSGARRFDAFEVFAHFEHRGDRGAAARAWQAALTPRDAKGRWTGHTAVVTDKPAPMPDFVTVAEAGKRIREAVRRFVKDKPPVMAIAASPGAGKSRHAREVLAEALPELGGDIAFYCPTLELAEEAAKHFRELGVQAVAVKGRLATDLGREEKLTEGDELKMCLRPGLVRTARNVGLAEGQNLCRRGKGLLEERCPHWDKCPWVQQWDVPKEKPIVRCMAHNYLHLPDGSGRGAPALHVVDEACWQGAIGKGEVPIGNWLENRWQQDSNQNEAADMLAAARDVLAVLQDGGSLQELALHWTAEDFREFAKAEDSRPMLGLGPGADDSHLEQTLAGLAKVDKHAGKRAAVWRVLAEALEAGREASERVLVQGEVLVVHWRREMPSGPTLHLDADADEVILGALYPAKGKAIEPGRAHLLLHVAEEAIREGVNAKRRREALVEGYVHVHGPDFEHEKALEALELYKAFRQYDLRQYQNLKAAMRARQAAGWSRCAIVASISKREENIFVKGELATRVLRMRERRAQQTEFSYKQFRYQAKRAAQVREDMADKLEERAERAKRRRKEILKRLRNWHRQNIEIVKAELRPRAEVVQLTDKTFSKRALLGTEVKPGGEGLRKEVRQLVLVEGLRDRAQNGGGVLVVASKAVVERFFEDAGRKATLGAELYGARWIWFGPASKGLNDWRDFTTVIELGREELPPNAIADQARGLWGDGAEPLELPQADEHGNVLVPEAVLPVLMADGSAKALHGRAYADSRLRALQLQSRENGGRQGAERLRMAHGVFSKRWVRVNNVPLHSAPVSELVSWAELVPDRLQGAVAEAAQNKGVLRLSPKGLAEDAPGVFPSVKAAERWKEELTPKPLVDSLLGVGGLIIEMRQKGQRGRHKTTVIIPAATCPEAAKALLEQEFGPLAHFEVLETCPTDTDSEVSETHKRLEYISKALGYTPPITVRAVESPVFIAGQMPTAVMAESLRRRGWQVRLE